MWRASFLSILLVIACGSDDDGGGGSGGGGTSGLPESKACDEAAARFQECGLNGSAETKCTGVVACVAECVKAADCETLTGMNIAQEYEDCLSSCG